MTTVICPRWPEQSQGFILFQCETAFNDAQLGFHFRFWNIPHAVYAAASWTYGLGDGSGSGGERKAAPDEFQFNSTSGHSKSSSTDTTGTCWEVVQLHFPTFLTHWHQRPLKAHQELAHKHWKETALSTCTTHLAPHFSSLPLYFISLWSTKLA